MIGKKLKGNIIQIQNQDILDEIESYTLLGFTVSEFKEFINLAIKESLNGKDFVEIDQSGYIIHYNYKDTVDEAWNNIVLRHSVSNIGRFDSVNITYMCPIKSSEFGGCLFRDQEHRRISLISKDKCKSVSDIDCTINKIGITKDVAEMFKRDAEEGDYYKEKFHHTIDYKTDGNIYLVWSRFITIRYLNRR